LVDPEENSATSKLETAVFSHHHNLIWIPPNEAIKTMAPNHTSRDGSGAGERGRTFRPIEVSKRCAWFELEPSVRSGE